MKPRVAVVQFPGVNCEVETLRAVVRAGLEGEIFRWTRPPDELRTFQAYVLPGGFSWQDRVRAGALAAKDPMVRVVAEESTARAKPVLGICNGAQVLVEAGLVPGGGGVQLALARNRMPGRSGYYARWIHVRVEPSPCVFTRALLPGTVLPLPVAHAEGRFTARDRGRLEDLSRAGQVPLRYASSAGSDASGFPENPNGSDADAAAVCDARGLVLAIMAHPERAQDLGQLSRAVPGGWAGRRERAVERGEEGDTSGPGLALFEGLRRHLEET
ncbi:MAG TPA: phosphoribosylformylglycinamidine synthase I [Terriglobales bacterium]|nr:phosphoribosylformylglycinamidine synthase I [Terriglobales bacterium]